MTKLGIDIGQRKKEGPMRDSRARIDPANPCDKAPGLLPSKPHEDQ
jgi:hypothetical protein